MSLKNGDKRSESRGCGIGLRILCTVNVFFWIWGIVVWIRIF